MSIKLPFKASPKTLKILNQFSNLISFRRGGGALIRAEEVRLFTLLLCLLTFSTNQAQAKEIRETKTQKVYRFNIASGKFQKVDTLSPINLKQKGNPSEAVILLPGLNSVSLSHDLYEWRNFWNAWSDYKIDKNIKEKYKFLVFRYDGWDSLHTSAKTLTQGIKELLAEEKNIKAINFIGYSQGGLLPRIIFVNNPNIEQITNKVQTLATPHQGTITLTKQLTLDSIATQGPLTAAKNKKALQILSRRYKNAYKEQAWTNFDGSIPPSANYTPPEEAVNLPKPQDLSKFIVYASYIKPPVGGSFENNFSIFFSEVIPRMFWDRRAGMKELNRWMAKKIYKDEEPRLRASQRMNDGVLPLASGLWAKVCEQTSEQPKSWAILYPSNNYCPSTPLQRAFYGADHLLWREELATRKPVRDTLHPNLEKKPLYSWVIDDLINI